MRLFFFLWWAIATALVHADNEEELDPNHSSERTLEAAYHGEEDLEPYLTAQELILGATTDRKERRYGVYVLRPMHPWVWARQLHQNGPEIFPAMWHFMQENRIEADHYISIAAGAILDAHREHFGERWTDQNEAWLSTRLADLHYGGSPLILITDIKNPYHVYYTVAVSYDYGQGLPSQQFLNQMGLPPVILDPILPHIERGVPINVIEPGRLTFDQGLSTFLTAAPHLFGARAEVRVFTRANPCPEDLVPILHRLLIADNFTLFSGRVVDQPPPFTYSAEDRKYQHYLWTWTPLIDRRLIHPKFQRRAFVDELLIWMMGRGLKRMYVKDFAFEEPFYEHAVNPDRPIFVAKTTRVNWETKTVNALKKRPGFDLIPQSRTRHVRQGELLANAASCTMILGGGQRLLPGQSPALTHSLYFQPIPAEVLKAKQDFFPAVPPLQTGGRAHPGTLYVRQY